MFVNHDAWPPAPDGDRHGDAPGPVDPRRERRLMLAIGVCLLAVFLGPFAGTSIIAAIVALF